MNIEEFKSYLEQKFIKNIEKEWVDVYIAQTNRVDVTIVSNSFGKQEESKQIMQELFEQLEKETNLIRGFLDCYTIEEAEFLGVERPKRNEVGVTWADLVQFDKNPELIRKKDEKQLPYKMISFYSYKGGVGRTIAMIQTAYLLAKEGKNVVLIDLDIEAPSLHKIFKKEVQNPEIGLKFGLVDYLYEQITNTSGEFKIKITDIFVQIEFEEHLRGNIYVVPATKELNSDYIYKVSQLQVKIISEEEYFEEFMKELNKGLKFDLVLIDTRTGLNQWGAFSLLAFAQQVIFIAYPNEENLEGLKCIMSLMKKTGFENFAIALSRIEPKAIEYAEQLFTKLNDKQEFISILYNPRIAVAKSYPMLEVLDEYANISDFILEGERIKENCLYIEKLAKNNILDNILDSKINFMTRTEHNAISQENVSVIVTNHKIEDNEYNDVINEPIDIFSRGEIIGINSKELMEKFALDVQNSEIDSLWIAYFLYIINENGGDIINGIPELKEKKFSEYIKLIKGYEEKNQIEHIIELFNNALRVKSDEEAWIYNDFIVIIKNIREIYSLNEEFIERFLVVLQFLKLKIENLRIVTFFDREIFDLKKDWFLNLKGSIVQLEWNKLDVEDFVLTSLNEGLFRDYLKIKETNKKDSLLLKGVESNMQQIQRGNRILELFWGIRIQSNKYTKTMIDWFFEKLKETKEISKESIIDILEKAIKYEKETSEKSVDRVVSFESFEKAFAKVNDTLEL